MGADVLYDAGDGFGVLLGRNRSRKWSAIFPPAVLHGGHEPNRPPGRREGRMQWAQAPRPGRAVAAAAHAALC